MQNILFLKAQYTSVFDLRTILFLFVAVIFYSYVKNKKLRKKKALIGYLFLCFVATVGHALNIRYKIQWFIPLELRYNVLEDLYMQARKPSLQPNVSRETLQLLANEFAVAHSEKLSTAQLRDKILFPKLKDLALNKSSISDSLLMDISEKINQLSDSEQKPLILVYLVESLRAIDIGYLQGRAKSLTPNFDQLAEKGVYFSNAWSASFVTRSGQEAVFCSYLSSVNHSLMQEHPELDYPCIMSGQSDWFTFWIHGGEKKFDNQAVFWQKQKISLLLDNTFFPESIPKGSWGFHDKKVIETGLDEVIPQVESGEKDLYLGMILSMTNHIPWDEPSDFDRSYMKTLARSRVHPSEVTVQYTDQSLATLTNKLKENHLWSSTVLVVLGDHGIIAPSLYSEVKTPHKFIQQSRIPILLSGGVVEDSLLKLGQINLEVSQPVSQIDVGAFLAYISAGNDEYIMGEPLLKTQRARPVIVDFGDEIFLPEVNKVFSKDELLSVLEQPMVNKNNLTAAYYLTFLQELNLWLYRGQLPTNKD